MSIVDGVYLKLTQLTIKTENVKRVVEHVRLCSSDERNLQRGPAVLSNISPAVSRDRFGKVSYLIMTKINFTLSRASRVSNLINDATQMVHTLSASLLYY